MAAAAPPHPNLARLEQIVAAFNGNDVAALQQLVSPALHYRMEGASPLAGIYRGHEGMRTFVRRIHDSCGGTLRVTPITTLANERWVVLYARVTAQRGGRVLDGANLYLYEFEDGMLHTARNVPCDARAWDAFWS